MFNDLAAGSRSCKIMVKKACSWKTKAPIVCAKLMVLHPTSGVGSNKEKCGQ
jgi:hypothetical protein